MSLIHYTIRNKIFYTLHLWWLISLQAKLRYYLFPKNPKAALWKAIVRDHYIMSYDKGFTGKIKKKFISTRNIDKTTAVVVSDEDKSFIKINKSIDKLSSNRHALAYFLDSSINRLKKKSSSEDLKVKYLQAAYEYFFKNSPHIVNNLILEIAYLSPTSALQDWAWERFETHRFHKVTQNGYDTEYDYSFVTRIEIVLVAENYKAALASIMGLPKNSLVKCYLIDEEAVPDNKIIYEKFNQEIHFYGLLSDIATPWSEINFQSVRNAGELALRSFDFTMDELSNLQSGYDLSKLKDPALLCIEDLALKNVKILTALESVINKYPDIYLCLSGYSDIEIYFFSLLQNTSKNVYISAFSYSRNHSLTLRQPIYSQEWHETYIKPLFGRTPKIKRRRNLESLTKKEFENYRFAKPLFETDDEYVFSAVNLRDPNYSKAAQAAICNLLTKTSVAIFYQLAKDKKVKQTISEIKSCASDHTAMFISFSPKSHSRFLTKKFVWQDYVIDKLLSPTMDNQRFVIDGIDYKFVIKHSVKNFLYNYLPSMIRLRESLIMTFDRTGHPKSALLMPTRTAYTWLFADVLRERGIKILDQQVLFQSNHPRYKPSKANVISLLNDEQIDIYKSTFPVANDQEITKFGSILYKLVQDQIKKIDPQAAKEKYNLPKDKKIIVIATQNTLSEEFLAITSHIAQIAAKRPDLYIVVKLHPKEDPAYVKAYNKAISSAPNQCLVTMTADMYEVMQAADILVTIFSNVGMEAALNDKDVILANLTNMEMPVDLAKQGLGVEVKTPEQLEFTINDLLSANPTIDLKKTRAEFINANIEIVDGKVLERITDYLAA